MIAPRRASPAQRQGKLPGRARMGVLASVTDLAHFAEANALAVERAPGVWEVLQAGPSSLLPRGATGSPGCCAASVARRVRWRIRRQRVVVLDEALAVPVAEADLGLPATWRIGPAALPFTDEAYVAASFTPEGAGLRPLPVVDVEQPWRRARSPGDLTIRLTRQSRALVADSWGGRNVPLAEEVEAYEVVILVVAVKARSPPPRPA